MKTVASLVKRCLAALIGVIVGALLGFVLALAVDSDAYLWWMVGGAVVGAAACFAKPGLAWLPFEIASTSIDV